MATHPTLLVGLSPAIDLGSGDVLEVDLVTSAGTPINGIALDGTYNCAGLATEYATARYFDDSTGFYHPQSPRRFYVGGSIAAPNAFSATQADGATLWTSLGFTVQISTAFSDLVPLGCVIAQRDVNDVDIPVSTLMVPGATIKLVINSSTLTIAPNVVGLQLDDAAALILAVPATVVYATPQYNLDYLPGYVMAQSPAGGIAITTGAPITITVSLGREPVTTLNPRSDYGLVRDERGPISYEKSRGEEILVEFPWASRLNGDTIDTVTYTMPDGLSNEAESGTTSMRSVRVSGGTARGVYRIVATITTLGGLTLEWIKRVKVIDDDSEDL